jgi:hypothetical protein
MYLSKTRVLAAYRTIFELSEHLDEDLLLMAAPSF